MKKFGTLYLIPVTLGADNISKILPTEVVAIAQKLENFVVENEKTARHFLSTIKTNKPVRELQLNTLNEQTTDQELPGLLKPLLAGIDIGLMSEAGCPGVADPGAKLAQLAHEKGIRVAPLVGPSSILLGLMASGLNGQRFTFLGYIQSEKSARIQRIKEIEKNSARNNETQIFIETPYRNQHLFEDILAHSHENTKLCIACNISLDDELIITKSIADWKKMQKSELPDLHKKPTIFLILS